MFRDCIKTVSHMVPEPNKVKAVRLLVRSEFERNKYE